MTEETVHIRFATREDYPYLPEIERSAGALFRQVGIEELAEAEPVPQSYYEKLPPSVRLLIAELIGTGPVGFALVTEVDGEAHLKEISVCSDQAGRGIGRNLLKSVITDCRAQKWRALTLTTFQYVPFNAPFYGRMGFTLLEPDGQWPGLARILQKEREIFKEMGPRIAMIRGL
ncbi:GNAT family N-acetyltransferase [Sneathiella limimaris]|uniref:GNAT family N-acetyltransferase n=1 Tax=Sneathiella limimaris TaxID=1964213 RepID=UPI00146A7A5B|nr:GNAT family N-acetyltransferase [Sneathiella limimaris]